MSELKGLSAHEIWLRHEQFFTLTGQRDDATTVRERHYWIGYIDAAADYEGLREDDLAEISAAYELIQIEAKESMKRLAAHGRARRKKRGKREP